MEFLVILFVIWAAFGLVAAGIAVSKGGSGAGWFILGVLFGPLAWLAVAVKAPANGVQLAGDSANGDDRYPCPYCAERIKPQARICRFCSAALEPQSVGSVSESEFDAREAGDAGPDSLGVEEWLERVKANDNVFVQLLLLVRFHLIAGLVVNFLLITFLVRFNWGGFFIILAVSIALVLRSGWLVGKRTGVPLRALGSGAMVSVCSILLPVLATGLGVGFFSSLFGLHLYGGLDRTGSGIVSVGILIVLSMILSVVAANAGKKSSISE